MLRFLIEMRGGTIKSGFIEQKPLDGAEYLASLGMTLKVKRRQGKR